MPPRSAARSSSASPLCAASGSASSSGGTWSRRKGTGEDCARRIVDLVNGDSDTSIATRGYCGTEPEADASAAAMCRCNTPSISRTYLGLIFFFSALHCARTRKRRRSSPPGASGAPGPSRGGSHHQPMRSIPPSDLPPTRRRDMDMCSCRSPSARSSNSVPLWTAERTGAAAATLQRMED
ncbi:unnamed protein product, partial [Mycena citricolor]